MLGWRITPFGDAALLVEAGEALDPDLNDAVLGVAAALRAENARGVLDVVSAFASLVVHFDPLVTDVGTVRALVEPALRTAPPPAAGRTHRVPVCYDEPYAPDLAWVADEVGLTRADVVARHAGRRYRVYMVGFLPGFPYLGRVDDALVLPRRATPRVRVPAGSVGIAGQQTGIYPTGSPGGWHVIGRTPLVLFDASRTPPALMAPGDTVEFVSVSVDRYREIEAEAGRQPGIAR